MAGLKMSTKQKLQQRLSPQQIQMIKLLELPIAQLEQRIKQEIEENPVVEENVATENNTEEDQAPKDVSVDEFIKENDAPYYKMFANNYSPDDKVYRTVVYEGRSLHEYLLEQLGYRNLSESESGIVRYIIGNIDDDGYLRLDLESVSDDIAFNYGVEVSVETLEKGLEVVQSFEPAGIGARDLRECLLLQLDRVGEPTASQKNAIRILSHCFTEFSKKHYDKIMSRIGIDEAQLRSAIEDIQKLSPRPGSLYDGGGNIGTPYIVPDFILEERDNELILRLNSYNIPELKISSHYRDMVRDINSSSAKSTEQEREAAQFVKHRIDSANWFISAIKQRQDTLLRTMRAIIDYQREYFMTGDEMKLKPMILKDIADLTNFDVSTISRVVSSKYIQTNFGIVYLKDLFSEAMMTDSGCEVSAYEIKNILEECVANEDKRNPLTDEALMNILNKMGYQIARRTVAKYRESAGIPVSRLRKEI